MAKFLLDAECTLAAESVPGPYGLIIIMLGMDPVLQSCNGAFVMSLSSVTKYTWDVWELIHVVFAVFSFLLIRSSNSVTGQHN